MRSNALRARTAPRTDSRATAGADEGAVRAQAIAGLLSEPKTLPPSLFYDATGARLFEEICELPEYYITRTETALLSSRARDIARLTGPGAALIEYGSGAGEKVRLLLDALRDPAAYVPVDISHQQLAAVAEERAAQYPGMPVRPVCADYTRPFELPPLPRGARRVAFFPGSTIGNFHPPEAARFLQRVRATVGATGALVLGVDRRKNARVLHDAYNDAAGVTAQFNLNMLARLNREAGADFDLGTFEHRAFFNDDASRIEMHLESTRAQVVTVGGVRIPFAAGETIRTECSYKYDHDRLDALVKSAGFEVRARWTDRRRWFWVVFLVPRAVTDPGT